MVNISDYCLYGNAKTIETEDELLCQIANMVLLILTSTQGVYNELHQKIILYEDFLSICDDQLKPDLEEGMFLHSLFRCAKECLHLGKDKDVLLRARNYIIKDLGEWEATIVHTVSESISLIEIIDDKLVLPDRWFSPSLYKKIAEFLKTFTCVRIKYKGRLAFDNKGEFSCEQILEIGKSLNGVSLSESFDFYPTPDSLVTKVQQLADISEEHLVLEPSAGTGSLLKGIKNAVCVETNPILTEILKAKGFTNVQNKLFENFEPEQLFDRIVMNPPFSKRLDAIHIAKALELLKDGGVLVAIHSTGILSASDKYSKQFQDLYEKYGVTQILVEAGAFKDSGKGTPINTCISKFMKG